MNVKKIMLLVGALVIATVTAIMAKNMFAGAGAEKAAAAPVTPVGPKILVARKALPVGTIIVKEATGGTMAHELFAMVKRGGGFNSGAPGWEWFELENLDDGKDGVKIVWRGFGPPVGEEYGGDAEGGCNKCHGACSGNDSVCSSALQLTNF